jgi:hypothetical protein
MLINKLAKDCLNNIKPNPVFKLDTTKIYLTKRKQDNWYRVKIIKVCDNQIQVFCIDEGNTLFVNKNNLILLEEFSDVLVAYPNQVNIKCIFKISRN